jgi:hypothetical protein
MEQCLGKIRVVFHPLFYCFFEISRKPVLKKRSIVLTWGGKGDNALLEQIHPSYLTILLNVTDISCGLPFTSIYLSPFYPALSSLSTNSMRGSRLAQ